MGRLAKYLFGSKQQQPQQPQQPQQQQQNGENDDGAVEGCRGSRMNFFHLPCAVPAGCKVDSSFVSKLHPLHAWRKKQQGTRGGRSDSLKRKDFCKLIEKFAESQSFDSLSIVGKNSKYVDSLFDLLVRGGLYTQQPSMMAKKTNVQSSNTAATTLKFGEFVAGLIQLTCAESLVVKARLVFDWLDANDCDGMISREELRRGFRYNIILLADALDETLKTTRASASTRKRAKQLQTFLHKNEASIIERCVEQIFDGNIREYVTRDEWLDAIACAEEGNTPATTTSASSSALPPLSRASSLAIMHFVLVRCGDVVASWNESLFCTTQQQQQQQHYHHHAAASLYAAISPVLLKPQEIRNLDAQMS
eukprot:TRINITY_DN8328_c0_g2_i1.p1 TRINITY_DN8328_c0_g2~~TRINITY_DN8328_c0_g2_i1.p1  ORF type:complete len:364 (+),score=92.93 TRINITY_DN8328_c0_g2_i1:512-1603(+)